MKQRMLFFTVILASAVPFSAQEAKQWSLKDCIRYALDKNIQLQQDKISLQESEEEVRSAKAALFPSLSFNTGQNIVNRPFQEQSAMVNGTEIIESNNKTTYNGSYNLSAQWTVWNGNKRLNNIKQQKTNRNIARLNVSEAENTLQEEIARLFIQILYTDESVAINKATLEGSQATFERGEELFNEGSLSKADLAQLEAQVSNDQYQLVTAESTLRSYKLQLKQLLELDGSQEMNLILPQPDDLQIMALLPSKEDVYQTALLTRPEIQSGKLSIENAKLSLSSAKAGYMPTISLSASISSMTNNASQNNWAHQMKYGWNNMIGLNISIPIFDQRQTKTAVRKARLQYNASLLTLSDIQKTLYSNIENAYLDALNAQQQYKAAGAKLKSSQLSFDMVSEQFNLGMKNTVELLTEKNNLQSAQQQCIQAKYMALLNCTLLNFYAGREIEL